MNINEQTGNRNLKQLEGPGTWLQNYLELAVELKSSYFRSVKAVEGSVYFIGGRHRGQNTVYIHRWRGGGVCALGSGPMHTHKRSGTDHSSTSHSSTSHSGTDHSTTSRSGTSRSGTDLTELERLSEAGEEAVGGFCIVRLTGDITEPAASHKQRDKNRQLNNTHVPHHHHYAIIPGSNEAGIK